MNKKTKIFISLGVVVLLSGAFLFAKGGKFQGRLAAGPSCESIRAFLDSGRTANAAQRARLTAQWERNCGPNALNDAAPANVPPPQQQYAFDTGAMCQRLKNETAFFQTAYYYYCYKTPSKSKEHYGNNLSKDLENVLKGPAPTWKLRSIERFANSDAAFYNDTIDAGSSIVLEYNGILDTTALGNVDWAATEGGFGSVTILNNAATSGNDIMRFWFKERDPSSVESSRWFDLDLGSSNVVKQDKNIRTSKMITYGVAPLIAKHFTQISIRFDESVVLDGPDGEKRIVPGSHGNLKDALGNLLPANAADAPAMGILDF